MTETTLDETAGRATIEINTTGDFDAEQIMCSADIFRRAEDLRQQVGAVTDHELHALRHPDAGESTGKLTAEGMNRIRRYAEGEKPGLPGDYVLAIRVFDAILRLRATMKVGE